MCGMRIGETTRCALTAVSPNEGPRYREHDTRGTTYEHTSDGYAIMPTVIEQE